MLRPALKQGRHPPADARRLERASRRSWLQGYFHEEILPVLSPLGLDPAHPFPRILNKTLNFAVVLKGKDAFGREGRHGRGARAALAAARSSSCRPISTATPRPRTSCSCPAILHAFVDELFPGMQVTRRYQFRVTRNCELAVDEDEVENLASALKDELVGRGFGARRAAGGRRLLPEARC